VADKPLSGEYAPSLTVRTGTTERILPPGHSYLVGRDPECDIVITDARVSWRHAVFGLAGGRWVLADNGSTNGTFADGRRADRIEITGPSLIRLGHATDGAVLACTVGAASASLRRAGQELPKFTPTEAGPDPPRVAPPPSPAPHPVTDKVPVAAAATRGDGDGPLEIPYAIRWLVPRGERFANFDILNDNDSQLEYYRRFGHIYAVGIPTKKWRLVVVSDPVLLNEVAGNEEQFGKRVEEINFFAQLSNSRCGGISVIGDGEHYDQIRRVMLPWYAPSHQRTQLERMKDQARKLVADWTAIPAGTTLEARTWMERYALEVSGRGACAYDFGLLGHAGQRAAHPFAAAVPASTRESIRRVADPSPDFTVFAGRAARRRRQQYRRHNQELYKTAGALVQARLHGAPLGQQTDLLSRLVSTPDPETGRLLDAETIRDQVLMHLSNGFNGPSITGAWLTYLLATHPDVEAKLIAEIDGITGGDPDYDLKYDDLFNLTYTTQVIKETMRIYPPQPVTIRRSLKDGMLGR
jgi:cytochrome P450